MFAANSRGPAGVPSYAFIGAGHASAVAAGPTRTQDHVTYTTATNLGTRIAFLVAMRRRNPEDRRCTYLVVIDSDQEPVSDLRDLASYLSDLRVTGCDVVVVDGSPQTDFEIHAQTLRWVSHHVMANDRHRSFSGAIDPIRAAIGLGSCEKVIVAPHMVRYGDEAIERVAALLDTHEVVEPQDYFDPLPWWSGVDAGRMLVHRGVDPLPDHGVTFGMRKSCVRRLRTIDAAWSNGDDAVRRLAAQGAEVLGASDVFVRRLPPAFFEWLRGRPRQADDDFASPLKAAMFFAVLPMAALLAVLGGLRLAGGFAGAITCASMVLAIRGRAGAAAFFPLRACFNAPLWVLERSLSVYWALFRKLRNPNRDVAGPAIGERKTNPRTASGG